MPDQVRRGTLAVRMLGLARSLPPDDPLRAIAEADPKRRLISTTGWRRLGRAALHSCGLQEVPVEERLQVMLPPWQGSESVTFRLDLGSRTVRRDAPDAYRREVAEDHLATLPDQATSTWIWSDGSAEEGTKNGWGGALILLRNGEHREVRIAAGSLCSSTRAELFAMKAALEEVSRLTGDLAEGPVVLCADSQAALSLLQGGANSQTTPIGAAIWHLLLQIASRGQDITMQWVIAHCGIQGNERADELAREATDLPQQEVPAEARAIKSAVARAAAAAWRRTWSDSLFKRIWGDRMPTPVSGVSRGLAVDVHQLRAGHCSMSSQYLHRIGRLQALTCPGCPGCPDPRCPAARCAVCKEEADTTRLDSHEKATWRLSCKSQL